MIPKRCRPALLLTVFLAGCSSPSLSPEDQAAMQELASCKPKYKLDNEGRVMELSLEFQALTDDVLDEVRKLGKLRTVSLYGSKLTDDSLRKIAKLEQLEALGLGGTPVSDQGIAHLRTLPRLRHLWLTECRAVTNSAVQELKTALPGLTVYR